jgi:hypothetical protein
MMGCGPFIRLPGLGFTSAVRQFHFLTSGEHTVRNMVTIMLISQGHYEIASSRARNLLASKHIPGLILRPLDSVRWHIVDHRILAFYSLLPYLMPCMMLSSWKV